jgi:hypothetical protein
VFRTQAEGVPSGPGDLDLTIYAMHALRVACQGLELVTSG